MALTIYGSPMSRTFRVPWMARELGLRYEHVPLDPRTGDTRQPDYLKIKITYTEGDGFIDFDAAMPATWSITVLVDGNQDGKWGYGPLTLQQLSQMAGKPSDDFDFGMGPDGSLCSQYIRTADAKNPEMIEARSSCQMRPSTARAVRTVPDESDFVHVIYRIPNQELFQDKPDAHIVFEMWTGDRTIHFLSAAKPLVIQKPPL